MSIPATPSALIALLTTIVVAPVGGAAQSAGTEWRVPSMGAPVPIPAAEYHSRRIALANRMGDGLLVVLGAASPGAPHVGFTQNPEFRYLTGLNEPGAALLIQKEGSEVRELIFVPPRDPAMEVWNGARLGVEGAERLTGVAARSRADLESVLDSLVAPGITLYTTGAPPADTQLLSNLSPPHQLLSRLALRNPNVSIRSLAEDLDRLRAAKSPAELDRIRRAVHITALAQRAAMRAVAPGMNEFELHALIEYTFRRHGAERPGFATIVGSGPNATTLHYTSNDRFLEPGDLVLMDIGAAFDGYTADVTRTIPVDGTFSAEQRAIYEIVLAAQKAAEARVRPGATWQTLTAAADSVLAAGLARLGLIDSPDATFESGSGSRRQLSLFYMHGLGHGIGLQVHDPEQSYSGPFRAGSAFTIEPGIYVRNDALTYLPDTPANRALIARLRPAVQRYRGIGVRIEDDYIVTADGVDRISAGAPREVADVEALIRLQPGGPEARQAEVVEWYRALRGG